MAKGTWRPPGELKEPAGKQLESFGITSVPGARINMTDPAVSKTQQRFFGAALSRKRKGRPREGDPKLSEAELEEFAGTKRRGLPKRKGK